MTTEQEKYVDCLRDDFSSIKSEIGRRSNLQRYILGVYVGLLAFSVKLLFDNKLSFELLIIVFGTSILAQIYHYRERLEINRLGRIISDKIAPALQGVLGLNSVEEIFHSQTNNEIESLPNRRPLSLIVNWTVFVIVPLLIALYFLVTNCKTIFIIIIALFAICLLGTTILFEHVKDLRKLTKG